MEFPTTQAINDTFCAHIPPGITLGTVLGVERTTLVALN
jgi:hypothetical protein